VSALTESEPFIAAMELMDVCRMCGGQNAEIAPFIVKFMTDEGLFDKSGNIAGAYVTVPNGRQFKPYAPRHDPSGWTPRLPEKEWLPLTGQVYRRDGYVCAYCEDTDGPFQIDHIVPVTRGGSNEIGNLCVACKPCNSSKGDRLLSEWRGRYR
jgi:hypothetical protein